MRYDIITWIYKIYKFKKDHPDKSNGFKYNHDIQVPKFQKIKTNIEGVSNGSNQKE